MDLLGMRSPISSRAEVPLLDQWTWKRTPEGFWLVRDMALLLDWVNISPCFDRLSPARHVAWY